MASPARRDIAPFMQMVRGFLLGRKHTPALRFADGLSKRTQPPPDVPGGPAHILSKNHYYKRNPRREVAPPIDVLKQKLIAGESGSTSAETLPSPGKIWQWD